VRIEVAVREKSESPEQRPSDEGNEQTGKATDAAEERLEQAGDETGKAKETAESAVGAAMDAVKETTKDSSQGLFSIVAKAAREAAAEVLEREARAGARQAAEYLSQRGPEIARAKIVEAGGTGPATRAAMNFGKAKLEGAGGARAVLAGAGGAVKGVAGKVTPSGDGVKGVVSKITPGGGEEEDEGGGDKGLGQTRRLPIELSIDIGAPREAVYNQWTQFEDAPQYLQRITSVDQVDDNKLKARGKIWGFSREWTVEIEEQIPNERIQWKTTGGTRHTGVVTFHELDEDLTRVLLVIDFPPQGLTEKLASGLRLFKRAAQADLMRFRAFIMMRGEETGEWRGRIEDSEVVSGEEEEGEEYEEEYEEPEAEAEEEEPEAEEEYEEPEAEAEEEEPEAEEEPAGRFRREDVEAEEEEEQPPPRRPQPRRQRSRTGTGSAQSTRRRPAAG
jgi:uncharacterized membrane protein